MKTKLLILLTSIVLLSCKTKTIYREIEVKDTIVINKDIIRTLPVASYIEIDKPCDSLGNLKPFTIVNNSSKAKVKVTGKDNRITVETNIDSIVQSKLDVYKSKLKNVTIVKEKKVIPKWAWYSLGINLFSIIIVIYRIKRKFFPL